MSDDEMEDYGFEYSDEDAQDENVDVENQYYNSKGTMTDGDPKDALKGFQEVVAMEPEQGEWGFRALKKMVKIHYSLGELEPMMAAYRKLLTYITSAVTRNFSEKKIDSLLNHVGQSTNIKLLQDFYGATLQALTGAQNERLWFKTQLKLCGLWFNLKEYGRAARIVKELRESCKDETGLDDAKKGTQLLEVYALEIQMYSEQRNAKALKSLYHQALSVKGAIPHPRILGVIRECGGKMHMHQRTWADANSDFFEAFKSYDEAGVPRRIQCLKYLVLASMLMGSQVDPFDAQEARPYKQDPEVLAMTNLVAAYQGNNIREFEKILATNRRTIYDDPFIRQYIDDLLLNIRAQVVVAMIGPYKRLRLDHIAAQLNIPQPDVEQLLVSLLLDERIHGRIDQVNQLLELGEEEVGGKHHSMARWAGHREALHATVLSGNKQ